MYAAPTQMPVIYQRYLMALGVQEFGIELIGTNNDVDEFTIIYDYNIPSDIVWWVYETDSAQTFYKNTSDTVGKNATITFGNDIMRISSQEVASSIMEDKYLFSGWNTKQDGSGFTYIDGESYLMTTSQTLYAQWK
jgi:hypothetical protein